jgi:peptidoglycan/LPS O-acetylase OafA/YrhL
MLRAVAALAVVAGHATDYLVEQNGRVPRTLGWVHGPAGVDVFFVISGFVMMISSGRLLASPHPARLFLERRLIRIAPLYWLLTAVRLLMVHRAPKLFVHAVPPTWNVVASFLFLPSRAPSGLIRPVIPVGWTLSFEMAFYLIFAAGLLVGRKVLWVVTPAIVALALLGCVRSDAWPVWTALADPIVLEFLAGCWLAWLLLRGVTLAGWAAGLAVAAGVAGLVLTVPGPHPLDRAATWGAFAVLVVGGALALEDRLRPWLPGWMLALGDASYSIYLVQMFVFPPLHWLLARVWPGRVHVHPVEQGMVLMGLSLVGSAALGLVTHRLVERPMTERLRRAARVSKPVAVTP